VCGTIDFIGTTFYIAGTYCILLHYNHYLNMALWYIISYFASSVFVSYTAVPAFMVMGTHHNTSETLVWRVH